MNDNADDTIWETVPSHTSSADNLLFGHVLLTFTAGLILALSSEVALRGAAAGVLVCQGGLALAWLSLRRARWGFPATAGARTSLILVIAFLLGLCFSMGFAILYQAC